MFGPKPCLAVSVRRPSLPLVAAITAPQGEALSEAGTTAVRVGLKHFSEGAATDPPVGRRSPVPWCIWLPGLELVQLTSPTSGCKHEEGQRGPLSQDATLGAKPRVTPTCAPRNAAEGLHTTPAGKRRGLDVAHHPS